MTEKVLEENIIFKLTAVESVELFFAVSHYRAELKGRYRGEECQPLENTIKRLDSIIEKREVCCENWVKIIDGGGEAEWDCTLSLNAGEALDLFLVLNARINQLQQLTPKTKYVMHATESLYSIEEKRLRACKVAAGLIPGDIPGGAV